MPPPPPPAACYTRILNVQINLSILEARIRAGLETISSICDLPWSPRRGFPRQNGIMHPKLKLEMPGRQLQVKQSHCQSPRGLRLVGSLRREERPMAPYLQPHETGFLGGGWLFFFFKKKNSNNKPDVVGGKPTPLEKPRLPA